MKTGLLNELLDSVRWDVTFANTGITPAVNQEGDPLQGEPVLLKWDVVRDAGVEFHMAWEQPCFVDCVVLRLGENTELTRVSVKNETGVLYEHRAETGKIITSDTLELDTRVRTNRLSLVLEGDFSDIEILSVELYGAIEEQADIFPMPEQAAFFDQKVAVDVFTCYSGADSDQLQAGKILAEKYEEITGVTLRACAEKSLYGCIRFEANADICPDGYDLEITETGAVIKASNLRGFVCGAECFIKLTSPEGVQTGKISDKPAHPFRGVHLLLPAAHQMAFARRLIKYLISPMGYNVVIIEVAAGMKFKSHPEINEAVDAAIIKGKQGIWPRFPHGSVAEGVSVEQDLVKEYVRYIRSFGIEVVPEVQSLGHVPFMTHVYPEIAEVKLDKEEMVDTRLADAMPDVFYPHCYCPSNEKSYELLFDLLDEILEVFEPKEYVHMGHDEVYYIGECPLCKKKTPAELFAYDINRIYDYLKKKGLKMMIWSDMLQPVTAYKTPPAIDLIPKDIVMLDFVWYFHLDKDIEDHLLDNSFRVAVGNLYSSHFPRYEHRIAKKGMLGGQISTWVSTNEAALQQEGKLYDLFMTAEMLWDRRYSHRYVGTYDGIISRWLPRLRDELRGRVSPSREKGAEKVLLLENEIAFPVTQPVEQISEFAVNKDLASLLLTHTSLRKLTRMPWKPLETVATYVLTYEDGTVEEVPVTNGGNIGYWNRRQNAPTKHPFYRHNGYTSTYYADGEAFRLRDGTVGTLYRYEHVLQEGKKLATVELKQNPQMDIQVVLCRAEGVVIDQNGKGLES